MTASGTPRCLDVTRLISRTGRGLTGVDRVELAYFREFLSRGDPVWFLARTAAGFAILDRAGGQAILDRVDGRVPWGRPDLTAFFSRKLSPERRSAEADLRRVAIAGASRWGLGSRLRQLMPRGTQYFNTGHSNLTDRVFTAWRQVPRTQVSVLIHDTIPLDFPQYQRPETVDRFRAILQRVPRHADCIIANSDATARDVARWIGDGTPRIVSAPLGVTLAEPMALPRSLLRDRPYFVALGTIEPRKNHALLLDIWDEFRRDLPETDIPRLVIAGQRGWRNDAVFARLDNEANSDGLVQEWNDLTDGQVRTLLEHSAGLLFPSHAEGFGLPAAEAILLGTRVLASNLSVFEEILGDNCIYAPVGDVYFWKQRILVWADNLQVDRPGPDAGLRKRLSWDSHFKAALSSD